MRALLFRAESILLLWTAASEGATGYVSSTSFPLGTPLEIDAVLNAYLDAPAKEVTSGHSTSISKRHGSISERSYDTIAMVWAMNVSTDRFERKDKDADATSKNSDRKSQDA